MPVERGAQAPERRAMPMSELAANALDTLRAARRAQQASLLQHHLILEHLQEAGQAINDRDFDGAEHHMAAFLALNDLGARPFDWGPGHRDASRVRDGLAALRRYFAHEQRHLERLAPLLDQVIDHEEPGGQVWWHLVARLTRLQERHAHERQQAACLLPEVLYAHAA